MRLLGSIIVAVVLFFMWGAIYARTASTTAPVVPVSLALGCFAFLAVGLYTMVREEQ